MSTLEEKLKRISSELSAYKPQDDAPRPDKKASFRHEATEFDVGEVSGGLLGFVDEDAVRVVCKDPSFEAWDLGRAAFVDTETTGLAGGSGTVAFLIGLGYVSGEKFVVEQFFMEDYDVEGEMLSRLCKKLEAFDWLVTFNGKCFDTPLIESRAILNRIRAPLDGMGQVDLLHAARRIYKKRLRQCSLGNLEKEVLGREREKDIPGSLVPVLFFEYLRSGDFEPMEMVLEHNRRDVASMLTLLCALCRAVREPEALAHAEDVWSCGRLQERMGRLAEAERCYRLSAEGGEGLRDLSLLLKRQGRHDEAVRIWLEMREAGVFGAFPSVELAKFYERRARNPQKALEIVEECMVKLRSAGVSPTGADYSDLTRRGERLRVRLHEGEN